MEVILGVLGFICLLVGLAGAVLPLPGPPLSFVGLLLLHYSPYAEFSSTFLIVMGVITALVTVADYYVPIWGAKRFGGTKSGSVGATIGMVVGLFLGPLGIFIGAFVGSLLGELRSGADQQTALRASFGTFIGFLAGIGLKLILCFIMLFYALQAIWPSVKAAF